MCLSTAALAAAVFCIAGYSTVASAADAGEKVVARYTGMLDELRDELTAKIPKIDLDKARTPGGAEQKKLKKFQASDKLDTKLVKFVLLHEATPEGLAKFAQQGKEQAALVEKLLAAPLVRDIRQLESSELAIC